MTDDYHDSGEKQEEATTSVVDDEGSLRDVSYSPRIFTPEQLERLRDMVRILGEREGSQTALARRLSRYGPGASQQNISKLLRGEDVGYKFAQQIALFLGVDVSDIIAGRLGPGDAAMLYVEENEQYPSRQNAVRAARLLAMPEDAVDRVLKMAPAEDLGTSEWFRTIERLATASPPSTTPVVKKRRKS